ncbi:MAG TPA: CHAD domain-containing protein [Solirubrobacteraceae bacterium]|nr:CHAD domain-containing protein [Solirubrobacteraceae bacterium]
MATTSGHDDDPAARTLVGAAAAGATAAGDPPPAPQPPSRSARRFRLRAGEAVADGLRRAARGQLADSSDALARATDRGELDDAVHDTRKSIKRVRATLRLSRHAIGDAAYERENAALRSIAGRLSQARDARVLIDTLADLERRFPDELPPAAVEGLHARLEDERQRAMAQLADDSDLAVTTRQALEDARARTADWDFGRQDFAAIAPGLRRVYARGRKRMRAAGDEPRAERLHDARKRVKDLWHAAELLRPAHPKRMKRLARDAHEVASLLGDHHDLSVLREYAESNPQLFTDMASRETLLRVLDRRRDELARRALKRGRRLYERPPRQFVAQVQRGWRKRVGD